MQGTQVALIGRSAGRCGSDTLSPHLDLNPSGDGVCLGLWGVKPDPLGPEPPRLFCAFLTVVNQFLYSWAKATSSLRCFSQTFDPSDKKETSVCDGGQGNGEHGGRGGSCDWVSWWVGKEEDEAAVLCVGSEECGHHLSTLVTLAPRALLTASVSLQGVPSLFSFNRQVSHGYYFTLHFLVRLA